MSGKSDEEHGKDDEKHGNGNGGSPYTIDETVNLEKESEGYYYLWDIAEDLDESSEYVIRAIARNDFDFYCYVLPKEEVEPFKRGESIWWEYRSAASDKLSDTFTVSGSDEDPYYHSGDYVLAIQKRSGRSGSPKVTLKFRESDS